MPFPYYQNLEKNLSAEKARGNEMSKKLAVCEDRNKTLKEVLKTRPETPKIDNINQAELDEIKKKALYEAERKYKSGIEKGPQ